jgi:hypothetical protein
MYFKYFGSSDDKGFSTPHAPFHHLKSVSRVYKDCQARMAVNHELGTAEAISQGGVGCRSVLTVHQISTSSYRALRIVIFAPSPGVRLAYARAHASTASHWQTVWQ